MEQLIKEKQNKIYWLALAGLFFGFLSLFWGIFGFIAIILGWISLRKIKKLGVRSYKELAVFGIILGVVGISLVLGRAYLITQRLYKSGSQEIQVTREDIGRRLMYTDFDCNVGITLTNGVYEGSDYLCNGETFKKVLFQIYDGKIAIGDLNNDGRDDVAVIIAKDYGDGRPVNYELGVSINTRVMFAKKRMLIHKARALLEGQPDIENVSIENGIISLDLIKCCPEEKENIQYIYKGNQLLQKVRGQ